MNKLLVMTGASVGGAVGWWAGSAVGLFTAFVLSTVGTGAGVYAARRLIDYYDY
jgi:hypothetical protein